MLIILFRLSTRGTQRIRARGEKTVNAAFYEYKGIMDGLLKRIERVRPSASCSRDFFFLLHDNAPAHIAASVCQLLTHKIVTTLYKPPPAVLSRFIYARLYSVPKVENEVKGTRLLPILLRFKKS
jgi:hypothetical protein